jgi:hypothetical protein
MQHWKGELMTEDRSYFIDDFSDETVPCETTLEGWAKWLAEPDLETFAFVHGAEYPIDGSVYKASALRWSEDIIAQFNDGRWHLSRVPFDGETFFAVRFGMGAGWDSDSIIYLSIADFTNPVACSHALCTELAELYSLSNPEEGQEEFIATGSEENGWSITFHAGPPPTCTAERAN